MRPIDADAVISHIEKDIETVKAELDGKAPYEVGAQMMYIAGEVKRSLKEYLDAAPTLDLAPVRHGEFERQPEEYIVGLHVTPVLCKTCDTTYFTMNKDGKRTICCPYCGALMDGKEDAI